jgi:hypothetical protein
MAWNCTGEFSRGTNVPVVRSGDLPASYPLRSGFERASGCLRVEGSDLFGRPRTEPAFSAKPFPEFCCRLSPYRDRKPGPCCSRRAGCRRASRGGGRGGACSRSAWEDDWFSSILGRWRGRGMGSHPRRLRFTTRTASGGRTHRERSPPGLVCSLMPAAGLKVQLQRNWRAVRQGQPGRRFLDHYERSVRARSRGGT